ncbi:hypothetical protein Tco_0989749 [Tanacetum coccineum]|uniref:Uncharacterized protein n=1 Tax=Tanacetum coccineum TaxID=301880 RepID=A0ABQ5EUR8_9ASTR
MSYMNKNYGTLPVTTEQLLDIKTAQAEETVPQPQYQFSTVKASLTIVTPIVSMYLMALISIIFKTEPSNMIYIMLVVHAYAAFACCFLINIYGDAKVNPLRSIRVRALEASYYIGLLLMPLFSVLGQFPHTKHCYGLWTDQSMEVSYRGLGIATMGGVLLTLSLQLQIAFGLFVSSFSTF